MEEKVRKYEKFIERESAKKLTDAERKKLAKYHALMVKNFQHERLIHLIVTLFFAFLAVAFVLITLWALATFGAMIEFSPLYLITLILVVLTVFYVKHYYFLENHIQGLYEYDAKLGGLSDGEEKA